MSKIADVEANATSLDGLVNDNGLIPTLRNGPKPSYQYLVDGWNTQIQSSIFDLNKSRGFRVVGSFTDGFTYELFNDVGIDTDGNSWVYVGAGAPNKVVTAGTNPVGNSDYRQVTYSDKNDIPTISALEASLLQEGEIVEVTYVELSKRVSAGKFEIISSAEAISRGLTTGYTITNGVFDGQAFEIANGNIAVVADGEFGFSQAIFNESGVIPNAIPDTASSSQRLDALNGIYTQSPFNSDKKQFISCIPRVLGDGSVSFVDDTEHDTLGFSGVSKVGDFAIRLQYTNTYEKVNNLSITVDDELCKYGVVTGGSVGVAHTDFTAYAQLSGLIDTTDMSFTGSGLFPDGNAVSVSYVDDVLIIDHDNHAFSQDSAVVSQVYGLSFMCDFGISQNASQINIIPWTEFAGSIIYDGSNFVNDPAKPWLVSSSQAGISMSWDATVNALKIDHPLARDYVVNVNSEKGGYSEYNVEVSSLSSFRVYFFDSSGVQITSPNVNMKIMFSRPSCQVRGVIPTGAKFNLRAGITPIRSANFKNAGGNNFWVSGMMQNPV